MAFVGYINGTTYRNGTNITYQSLIDGELVYEYQIYTIVAVFCEYPNWQKSYTTGIVFVKSKDTASYETLFKKLKELIGDDTFFRNRLDVRLCFLRYKESLADAADDYLRHQNGELMKRRKEKYIESERRIMQRKAEMKLLYEGYQENGNRPELDILLTYCSRQAWNSTEAMEINQQDPRFALQEALPIRPQYFQQPPMFQPVHQINLNQSLPVNYNHQFFIPPPQQQQFYQHFNPVYRF